MKLTLTFEGHKNELIQNISQEITWKLFGFRVDAFVIDSGGRISLKDKEKVHIKNFHAIKQIQIIAKCFM